MLLEALIALVIFSILLIGGAKIYSSLSKDTILYASRARESVQVRNVFFLIQNYLSLSFCKQFSSTLVTFYPLDTQAFFSTSFSLLPTILSDKTLQISYPLDNTSFLLSIPSNNLYTILRKTLNTIEVSQTLSDRYFLPLQGKYTLHFSPPTLYLNSQVLLTNLKSFNIQEEGEWIKLEICLSECYEHSFRNKSLYENL